MRRTIHILVAALALMPAAAAVGALLQARATRHEIASRPPPGAFVDIGGHRLHIWCTGNGSPAVILDAGLGGTAFDWGEVQPRVSRFTRVCSYDRAGMGYSDPGARPRTSARIARELLALLDGAGLRQPAVLVGASIGGWNVRVAASEQPNRVAGLVLVDARHEDQTARLLALGIDETPRSIRWVTRLAPVLAYSGLARLLGLAPGQPSSALPATVRDFAAATAKRSSVLVTVSDELANAEISSAQVRASRRDLPMPVVVVSAGQPGPGPAGALARELQRDQLGLSKRSCQLIAERSGHTVELDEPEAVVDGIRIAVEASRAGSVPRCSPVS